MVLMGGLGNQLFEYYAGAAYSLKSKRKVQFNLTEIPLGMTNHGTTLEVFLLNPKPLFSQFSEIQSKFLRLVGKINIINKVARIYISKEIGFDEELLNYNSPWIIRGYFQTWRYFEVLYGEGAKERFTLRQKTEWLREQIEIAKEVKPIVIHIRRGDYKKVSQTIGVLDFSYFINAMNYIPSNLRDNEIWIFSDEPNVVAAYFKNIESYKIRVINPPNISNAAESLVLMSYGSVNIISNSTFSWWSAFTNPDAQKIIAPSKWFKGLVDPIDLIPGEWMRCESIWE